MDYGFGVSRYAFEGLGFAYWLLVGSGVGPYSSPYVILKKVVASIYFFQFCFLPLTGSKFKSVWNSQPS